MTSTNDGKDVKSYQATAQRGKTYYIEFYKSLEAGLSSDCDLRGRTKHLCEAWRRIHSLCLHSTSTTHPHLQSWLQRHTAKIILQTEWQSSASKNEHISLTEAINDFISETQAAIKARNGESTLWEGQLLQRAEWFKKTLLSPWGHVTLKKLLDPQNGFPSDEEFVEWLKEERGIMVVTRLRQLAASKCDDLALSLATAIMDRVRAGIELHTDAEQSDQLKDKSKALSAEPKFTEILKTQAGFTSDIWELVIDIEFVLLHKCDKRSRCIELAKQTPLRTCYQLVERLENRLENSPKEKKLWKNAREVATLIAQVTIARCMVVGGCVGACRSALYWCARALTRLVAGARLVADTVALAAPAATARHLHTLAVAVHAQSTESMKPFVCELYVRALTAGMNELERLKMKTEKETEARGLEQTLSSWFTSLGSLLSGSPRVQCECTLTAFSVHPSSFMYEAIKKAPHLPPLHVDIQEKQQAIASEFGSWANDSRSQTNFVKTSETLNLKHQKQQSNILSTAILTEGEALGLSPVLCQDIAVLLSGPRLKTLSWDMDRETLLDNCRNYMERTQGGTRALTTELKYLNLDPKEFQHLPEEDDEEENDIFYGIEKGYEHLVELPPEEIWESANYSQGQSESPCSSGLDSDCYVVKLKKKSKQVSLNLSEDSDPLSLMAEAKRKAKKKERPHSKERHKDSRRKKTVEDPLDIREPSEQIHKSKEKIKNKPGRKKKDKQLLPKKTAPLSNLVGMKITKARDAANDSLSLTSVNDSDYDSQGKFSLNSINSEVINDVVFDGLYSMDELKSPEINANMEKIEAPKSSNEFCVVNGATNNTNLPIVTPCISDNTYPQFNVGNITQENGNDRNKDACTPTSLLTNANVTEEVKQKITRLIDFRRQTNITHRMSEQNNATLISLNDSINTDLLNSIRRTESQFLNRLTHSDVSNSMTRNEHDSTICSTTSNTINRQETKISNKFIHSDISNGMKRFESKTSNDAMNMDVSSYIKSFENNFLNSFIYSDMLNGINKSECPNNSLSVDTSIINRPENIKRSYSKHSNISNTIKSSDNNFQSQVTPKVVTIPDIPKVFISKKPIEETGQLHIVNNNNNVTHPVTYLAQKNDHKKSLSHVTVCNPYINPITEPQLKNQCLNQNAVKEKLLDIAQNHTPNVFTPEQSPNPIQSFGIAKQNKFQDFLKELQKSINAGAAVNNNKSLVTQTDTIPKEVQPATRITPVMPSVKKNDMKIQQNVQHKPPERFSSQKKIDNSLNTFSRLSYMHKNRQNDSKLKQVVDALVKLQDYDLPKGSVSKGPNQATDDTKNLKTNYVQSKTNVNKCIPFSASYDNTQIVTKAEKLNKTTVQSMKTSPFGLKINTSTQNSQLNFADIINENQIINRSLDKKSDKSGSICSSLSEKDQNDLVSLLRQQNKLNTTSSTKSNLTTNSEGNNISINKTSCSNNRIFNKHNLDIPCTSKVSKNEQVNKSSFKNSSISCTSTNPKTQKSYDIIKSDGNSIMSTTKISRSSLKNSDLEHHNVKKTEINKSGDLSNDLQNKPLKGTTSTDWESVMNAILAHKTPSRGPNALDVALNKSSFAKAFADSIRDNKPQDEKIKSFDKFNVTKPEPKQNIKSGTKTNNSEKSRSHSAIKSKKHATKRDPATNKRSNKNQIRKKSVSTTEVLNTNSNLVKSAPISSNSHTLDKKTSNSGTSKRLSVDAQKQFICPLPQEDDPFISGIANSDYDLLEELMDDDLRQEIGELSSDDDNFKVSMDTALKKSNIHLEKHTNDMFKKSVVITKPEVSIAHNFSELESNRKVPLSLLQCDNGVENIYTTPVKATQTSINNNPEILTEDPDNTNVYNKLNMRGSNQENNLITNKTDNHAKNNFRSHNTNEHLLSTAMNSQTLLTGTTVPQTFGNLVIVDPGVNYEQFSTSQTTLRNNVSPLPLNTYVEVNKTSDTSLYRTTPFVSPVVENKFISVTANQTVSTEIPKLLNVPEIQSSTHFDVTEIIKPTLNVSGGCKNELGNSTESKCNFNLDDQLIEISSKKGQTHLNVDIPKNNDRKVLSEVQDQQHFFFVDKNQDLITTRMMMSNDFKKINDQDRLKMKRLCIINRKIHHYSNDNPIPLSYMPLPLKSSMPNSAEIKIQSNKQGKKFNQTSAESIKTQRLDSLLNVKIQKIQNEIKCKTSKENKSENTLNLKSDSEKPKISKDNKSESMNCRRILLRSSNKIHRPPTDIDTDLGQHVNDKINKIKPKSSSFNCDDIKNLDVEKVSTCISKETNKGALDKSKDININEDSVIIQKVSRKKRKKKEKLNSNNLEQFPNNLTPTDPVDLEDQILGSKIPKNETSGATIKLQFNKTPDNTDTLMTNSHTLPQHVQNSDTIRKFDVQTQSDAINIIDSELTKDKRRADESVQNVIVTSRAQDTYKDHTDESNKVEIPQDLIDLTLENKVHTNATSLTQVDNLNQSVIQDKENLMYNQLQAKEPNVTVINKKVQNQSCLKNYSSNVHKGNDNVSGIPQFYKDSIKIIPLPNDARDPLKKFVRIKLPNGRTFKASSYGKEDVDFDMLFSNPSLKSVLLGGLTDKTCYTLNIKQVATTTLDNPKKILETRIQEINLEAKIPTGPIETIDLLSDDEDNITYQHFKTEFGDFKIPSLDNRIFTSHQKKFDQNCKVKLIPLSVGQHLPKLSACDNLYTRINNIESIKLKEKGHQTETLEIINKNVEGYIEHDSDAVEVSDIPKDTSAFITTIISEKAMVSNESISEQTMSRTDIAYTTKRSKLSDSHQSEISNNESIINYNLHNKFSSSVSKYGNCYVKLVNCDDVLKKYEKINSTQQKCVTDFIKCNDYIVSVCRQESNTNNAMDEVGTFVKQDEQDTQNTHVLSQTKVQDLMVGDILKSPMRSAESGRTSPVIDVFEKIASLNNEIRKNVLTLIQKIPICTCVAEWFVSKPQLNSRSKENLFNANCNKDRWKSDSNICVSEWHILKPTLSVETKITKNYNHQYTCKLDLEPINNVPKLTIIVNTYLQNNLNIYKAKCLSVDKNNSELNHSKNLKRKLSVDVNNDGGVKISKTEPIVNVTVTNYEQGAYNSTKGLEPHEMDNLETESNKSFDFLTVSYESDRESDVASNNSESILAEHADLFDNLILNEEKNLILNNSESEVLQTKPHRVTFSEERNIDKHESDKSYLHTGLVLEYNNTKTGMLPTRIVQSNLDDNFIKEVEVKAISKKAIAEDHKEQNILDSGGLMLQNDGSLINDENFKFKVFGHNLEMQPKLHKINSGGNYENNKHDKMYEVLDTKIEKSNETNVQDLANENPQNNYVNKRDDIDEILNDIVSNKNESSKSSSNLIICEIAPIIVEATQGDIHNPTAKCCTKFGNISQISDVYVEHSDKQADDPFIKDDANIIKNEVEVKKVTDECLPHTQTEHINKQVIDKVLRDNIYSIDNKVQMTKINSDYSTNLTGTEHSDKPIVDEVFMEYMYNKIEATNITDHYDMEKPLKCNNNSENCIMKITVSDNTFDNEETNAENIQFKKNCDEPGIIKGNSDHEYAAVYVLAKDMNEDEILNSVREIEQEECVFVIDDDTTLTDDNITETIVEMDNVEILDEDYIQNIELNNTELLSTENTVQANFDKTLDNLETMCLELKEKENEEYSKLDSPNKDSNTVDLVDSVINCPDILESSTIECRNKNIPFVPRDIKSTNCNENEIESLDNAKEILEDGHKLLQEDSENLKVLIPKVTYGNKINNALNVKQCKKILKRKIGMKDIKTIEKRYRKGKNIDHPKFTPFSCTNTLFTKEFARLSNYISSVKFSFSQPFHKENIDVPKMLTGWPIKDSYPAPEELEPSINDVLFVDLEHTGTFKATDPLEQTLTEELRSEYDESKYIVRDINENNFNMGFGEGSGRVIQNLEDGEDLKLSAATLPDVKQIQPFLLSEDYDICVQDQNAISITNDSKKDDQLNKIRHYLSYIQLKDKVQAFFRKTSKEFNSIRERNIKSKQDEDFYDTTIFPFGLTHPDFIEPGPVEAIVDVVQVGQLPVTAAAQNPVTCDPRVTQVSDASPPQCSDSSLNDDSQTSIKTEYTELTTADLSLPLRQEYANHNQAVEPQENSDITVPSENIPIETEIKSVVKIELMEELSEEKIDQNEHPDNCESPQSNKEILENVDYTFDTNSMNASEADPNSKNVYNSEEKDYNVAEFLEQKQQNVSTEKTDQIAHAMNAAGISTTETVTTNAADTLINILPENIQTPINSYTKTLPSTMSLHQALAQILPPVLNQNAENNQQSNNGTSATPQVLHIVQGKNASGNQITLVDNSQPSVINTPNSTPVLHFVQNKSTPTSSNPNGNIQSNSFSGLSLVDTGLQQGGNQLLQIVNTGNQKTSNAGQLLKQVNLLTNLTNVQGQNEQKMVQFLCKSADGKAIQLNGPHPRSMVLRIQPVESSHLQTNATKPHEIQDSSATNLGNHTPNKEATAQQEIKSRSVYEENYAKFIQNSSAKQVVPEKSTSLPKFNQAFGKQGYQDGDQKQNEINGTNSHLPSLNTTNENSECQPSENTIKLDHIGQMTSPPLLLRKSPAQTTQPQSNFIQQIKQTISPINLQSMHGSVIYRQIPVNLGSGQTINLITVPNTEVADDPNQKQQSDVKFMAQNEMEQSIIKIVPQTQPAPNVEVQQPEENNPHVNINNENTPNPQQPVLTQMRIKLPMLSKTPQMVSGARVVRPSFFQIQRNVIGANQQVYQQLVLTAAPPLGQQTAIRLPQTQNARQLKVPNDNPTASESQMSSSTLEQLREFDLVLEQVKERSTVQPNANSTAPFSQLHATNDTTDGVIATNSTSTEPTQQVLYSIGNNQPLNMSYVSRKSTIPTPTVSTYVRSPDSSGIVDSPPSSSHTQIPHTVTSDSTTIETPVHHKPTKSSKSKPRPKASSNPPNTLKLNTAPPKTSTQKPLEDEQTTQRILYILAEYKEQVENSPDKDKPAPRRRTNLPPNPGSSKRKKSSSSSRRPGGRDMSPVHGDDTCRTMGSEDSSCGTSQGDCNDCLENHSPQESPRKVVRKLSFEQESPLNLQRQIPQRNVIVADGQTITVARGTSGKPTTAVLMPANYILPVSMVKGGQQIAIVTNRGPKLLTVTSGEGGTTNALLLQRLITPAGFKPVLTRPGVRHVRLPAAALHSLQAFNFAPVTNIHPPDSTVSPAPAPTTPELVDTRANTSPWTERDSQEAKPDRGSSPEGSEPWNLPTPADPNDYSYEETVRTENMDRTVLDPIPDRYSPDMEAQRIFDKMFDVDSKKSFMIDSHADSPRCGYDIDTSDCDDKAYHQIVHKKEGTLHRQHRLTHVSAAALRHKYAILEHELRLQKSLSEECEDLGVDSPSASELFPEAELLFAASPAHDNTQDQSQNSHSHTPQPTHSCISQPDIDDQIATDQLLPRDDLNDQQDLQLGLEDVGIVTVSEDGLQATIALDHEEFARSHPNTTFHSEPTDESEMQPFTITGIKGRHITSTIFHSHRPTGTVLMTAPQTTVISQAIGEGTSIPNPVKYSDIENIIDALPSVNENNLPSVLVKDDGLARFDSILTDSRELHLSNTASAIVHSTGNATQVIRRVCCEENKRERETTYLINESHALIAGDDAKMTAEDSSRDGTMESLHGGIEEDRSSPERHTELFWESNSASERSECRRPLDYSSDSDKCCKSPFEETNSTDSGGVGTHLRLDSVIKEARGFGVDCSLGEDIHPPLRTYPPKRLYHGDSDRSHSGKTGVGDRCSDMSDVRRRASGRGVVKRGCHCCNGSPAPPRPKKSRQKKLIADFITNRLT